MGCSSAGPASARSRWATYRAGRRGRHACLLPALGMAGRSPVPEQRPHTPDALRQQTDPRRGRQRRRPLHRCPELRRRDRPGIPSVGWPGRGPGLRQLVRRTTRPTAVLGRAHNRAGRTCAGERVTVLARFSELLRARSLFMVSQPDPGAHHGRDRPEFLLRWRVRSALAHRRARSGACSDAILPVHKSGPAERESGTYARTAGSCRRSRTRSTN